MKPRPSISARDYLDAVARMEQAAAVGGSGLIDVSRTSSGTALSGLSDGGFWATLSGSSSPYSFTEQIESPAGSWASGPRTGTTNAYEVNSVASLSGKRAWLDPGAPGDYRFQWACDCAAVATLNLTVNGCGALFVPAPTLTSGYTVTLTQGGTHVTASVVGGVATFSLPSTGTWTWAPSAVTGYTTTGGTLFLITAGSNTRTVNLIVDKASGYFCDGCGTPVLSLTATWKTIFDTGVFSTSHTFVSTLTADPKAGSTGAVGPWIPLPFGDSSNGGNWGRAVFGAGAASMETAHAVPGPPPADDTGLTSPPTLENTYLAPGTVSGSTCTPYSLSYLFTATWSGTLTH